MMMLSLVKSPAATSSAAAVVKRSIPVITTPTMNMIWKRSLGTSQNNDKTVAEKTVFRDPVRQVFISQSTDVFTNLALEDWLYRHHDFDHKVNKHSRSIDNWSRSWIVFQHLLLLWRNDPCVVIGRHQNPWTESNLPFLRENEISLARRNSGGGTVYHDLGNLNCTFFTRRSSYDRRRNLDIICSAIRVRGNIEAKVVHELTKNGRPRKQMHFGHSQSSRSRITSLFNVLVSLTDLEKSCSNQSPRKTSVKKEALFNGFRGRLSWMLEWIIERILSSTRATKSPERLPSSARTRPTTIAQCLSTSTNASSMMPWILKR